MAADYDGDGRVDLYVANDGMANEMWLNRGDGTFVDDALLRGAALNAEGQPEASMGVVAGDLDGNGSIDLFMTHLEREHNTIYLNDGHGMFTDRSWDSGLARPSWEMTAFGVAILDVDADGIDDLYVANGAVRRIQSQLAAGEKHPLRLANQLFRGIGGGRFEEMAAERVESPVRREVGRGVAAGDVDNDGDLDLVVSNNAGPARLLQRRRDRRASATSARGCSARGERGVRGGRDLFGATATLRAPARPRARGARTPTAAMPPRAIRAFCSRCRPAPPRTLDLRWPDGASERYLDPPAGRYLVAAPPERHRASMTALALAVLLASAELLGASAARDGSGAATRRSEDGASRSRPGPDPGARRVRAGGSSPARSSEERHRGPDRRRARRIDTGVRHALHALPSLRAARRRRAVPASGAGARAARPALALLPDLSSTPAPATSSAPERAPRRRSTFRRATCPRCCARATSLCWRRIWARPRPPTPRRCETAPETAPRASGWAGSPPRAAITPPPPSGSRRPSSAQPEGSIVHYHLGMEYRALGELERARAELAKNRQVEIAFDDPLIAALQGLSESRETTFARGIELLERGQYEDAIATFERVLELDPKDAQAHYNLARALIEEGDLASAEEHLRAAVVAWPDFFDAHLNLAILLGRTGRGGEAAEHIERAVKIDPEHAPTRLLYARVLSQRGDHAGAIRELEEVLRVDPASVEARMALAELEAMTGDLAAAKLQLERVIASADAADRDRARAHQRLALLPRTPPVEVEAHLRAAAELEPSSVEARGALAERLAQSGRFDQAAAELERLIEIAPDDPRPRVGLATTLVLAGDYSRARAALDEGSRRFPDNLPIQQLLAQVLATCPDAALRDGTRAVKIAQGLVERQLSIDHVETLAMALAEVGNWDEATLWQRRAIEREAATGADTTASRRRLELYEAKRPVREPWKERAAGDTPTRRRDEDTSSRHLAGRGGASRTVDGSRAKRDIDSNAGRDDR